MKILTTVPRDTANSAIKRLTNPVKFCSTNPTYFVGDNGPVLSSYSYCDEDFAKIVMSWLDAQAVRLGVSIAHIGVYNPRMARDSNGRPLGRVSNHAYGRAIDFKGFIHAGVNDFVKTWNNNRYAQFTNEIKQHIINSGFKPEVVSEPGWVHIGIYL